MPGLIEQLDGAIAELLAGWNVYTSVLTVGILGFVGWVLYDSQDADTHPLLLARQAQASYVRQPGESATFRCPETPHGCTWGATSFKPLHLTLLRSPSDRPRRETSGSSHVLCW